jgi:hypothetical protein
MAECVVYDPGLSDISRPAPDGSNLYPETPTVLSAEVVARVSEETCEGCVLAYLCDTARANADEDYTEGIEVIYGEAVDADLDAADLVAGSLQKQWRARVGAINDFKGATPDCAGPEHRTIETTYIPFAYTEAGAIQRFWKRRHREDTAVHRRLLTVCRNPRVDQVIEAEVNFKPATPRST